MRNSVRILKDAVVRHVTGRILGLHSVAIAAAILCAGHFASREVEFRAFTAMWDRAKAESAILVDDLRAAAGSDDAGMRQKALGRFAALKLRATVFDGSGRMIADSDRPAAESFPRESGWATGLPGAGRAAKGRDAVWTVDLERNVAYGIFAADLSGASGATIRVALSPNQIRELRLGIRRKMIVWTLALLAFLGAASIIFFRIHSRKISRLLWLAEGLSSGKPIEFASGSGGGDIGRIEEALGALQQALIQGSQRSKDESSRLELMLGRMNEGSIAIDTGLAILSANPAAAKLLQVEGISLTGRSLIEAVRSPGIESVAEEALRTLKPVYREVEYFGSEPVVLSVNAVPLPHREGGMAAVLLFYDVTSFRRLERILKDFVANASHELKTPLTTIKGYAETLLTVKTLSQDRRDDCLRRIGEDADRMTRLVTDLLDLSQLESDVKSHDAGRTDMAEVFEKVQTALGSPIREKGVKIQSEIPPTSPLWVLGDPDDLFRAVFNIVDNAVKFNKSGGSVTFRAKSGNQSWEFEIQDTGIGIPAEFVPRIFERFYRVDPGRSQDRPGTGLGLAIAREIIEMAKGRIDCSSQLNLGTLIRISLPKA